MTISTTTTQYVYKKKKAKTLLRIELEHDRLT